MMALFLLSAPFGVLVAAMVLRADWRSRENQLCALVSLLDVGRVAALGLCLARDYSLDSTVALRTCVLGAILVVYPTLEFAYAFPSGSRPPRWARILGPISVLLACLTVFHPALWPWWPHGLACVLFFTPFFVLMSRGSLLNLRHSRSDEAARGVRIVLAAVLFRFALEFVTNVLVHRFLPELFTIALALDLIVGTLVYVLVAYVVLRYRLFRVRRMLAEGVLFGTLVLACVGFTVLGSGYAAELEQPALRALAFVALSMLPLGAWILIEHYTTQIESVLLCRFDNRRRQLKTVLERVLHESADVVDPVALRALTREAIASFTRGKVALWSVGAGCAGGCGDEPGPALPAALAAHLEKSLQPVLHRQSLEELTPAQVEAFNSLNASALVTVQAQGRLLCALTIHGRSIDQDVLDTARALADNLGHKLAHHALYERAFELQKQLEASRQLATLGSLVAAIAHDIRTPLTSIKMNLEMIQRSPARDSDTSECADIALQELGRMSDYVSGILDYVKPVQLRAVELDLPSLVEETARTLQPLLESRKLALHYEFPDPTALPVVRADATRMKQVFLNLLENAADASHPGHTIHIAAEPVGADRVAIRVTDHGHGIEKGHLERVFEPFFTTRTEGTGLGLAIVRKLVRAHDGDVQVDSAPGAGSTFTVVLPV